MKLTDPIEMRPPHFKDALVELMNNIKETNIVFAEIGSYRGESTEVFLNTKKIRKMYCIDPWANFYDKDDAAAFSDMEKVMAEFDARILNKYDIVEKHRGTIDTFVQSSHQKIDMVYIDGNHTYDFCKNDILKTIQNLDPTIAISGHDYAPCYGVYSAVNEIFGKPDITFKDSSWIVFKKNNIYKFK